MFIYSLYVAFENISSGRKIIIQHREEAGEFKMPTILICPPKARKYTNFTGTFSQDETPEVLILEQYKM